MHPFLIKNLSRNFQISASPTNVTQTIKNNSASISLPVQSIV